MQVKSIAVAIALSISIAGCGQGPQGGPGRQGRRVKRASPVLRDLLAHQDRPALKASKVLRDRLAPRPVKARYASRAPTVRQQLAEGIAPKTRCLWWRIAVPAEVLQS
jgi:hypothetical protein